MYVFTHTYLATYTYSKQRRSDAIYFRCIYALSNITHTHTHKYIMDHRNPFGIQHYV